MTPPEDHSDDIALAGEYALHLLDVEDRQAFERRMADEPQLRRFVADWDENLFPISQDFTPVVPPLHIKTRVEDILFKTEKTSKGSVWGWFLGLGMAAAVAVFAIFVVPVLNSRLSPEPSFVAQLAAEDQPLVVLANFFPDQGVLHIDRRSGSAPSGRALELWLIAEGASAPVSLGVLSADADSNIDVPEQLAPLIAGGTLAISDEPLGGSPTGAPTGAVLAAGLVAEI